MSQLPAELREEPVVLLVEQEALSLQAYESLRDVLQNQPAWSDLPTIVIARADREAFPAAMLPSENTLLLEQPIREQELLRMVEAALQVCRRQYQVRDQMAERDRTERALAHSEERLRMAMEATGLEYWDIDLRTGRIDCTDRLRALWGFGPGEPATIDGWMTRLRPEDRRRVAQVVQQTMEAVAPVQEDLEYRAILPDGSVRWFAVKGRVQFAEVHDQRRVVRAVGTIRDITARKQAEEQLRSTQERLQRIVNSGMIGICIGDIHGNVMEANDYYLRLLGLTQQDLLAGRASWTDVTPPEHLAADARAIAELQEKGCATPYEKEYIRRDGTRVPVLLSVATLAGSENLVVTFVLDMTEHRRAEEALRASELAYRRLFDNRLNGMAHGRVIVNEAGQPADFVFLEINETFEHIIGKSKQQLVGRRLTEVVTDMRELCCNPFGPCGRVALTGQEDRTEIHHPQLDRWFSIYVYSPQYGEFITIFSDITEQKRTEQALRTSEQAYRRLFDNKINGMAHGRVIVNEAGEPIDFTFLEVNDTFEQMTGLRRQEITGRRLCEVFPDVEQLCMNPVKTCAHVAMTGEEGQFEFFQEQLRRWYSVYAYSPRHGDFITIFTDITQRKQAEQQLKELNELLERRVAERTREVEERAAQLRRLAEELPRVEERERRRLAQVLHDHLQQLLVGARLSLSSLRGRLQPGELRETAEQVDDLLAQSVAMSRSLTAELSPPVLYESGLAQALEWLAGWMHDKHHLSVEVQADPAVNPPQKVRTLLFQAVRELLFNVVKHAGTSQAYVWMSERDRQLQIIVEDDGVGFDPQEAQTRRQEPGGFGLFSIGQRLEWLGGQMTIDSAPGRGTRVELLTPLQAVPPASQQDLLDATLERASVPPAERIRVLLADDHVVVRDALAQLLQTQPDIEIVGQADDGQQAVDLALQLHPDVVLMDVTMPQVNGIDATRRIKAQLPEVRVIGLSMHVEAGMADAMRQAGASDYLSKNTGPDVLIAAMHTTAT